MRNGVVGRARWCWELVRTDECRKCFGEAAAGQFGTFSRPGARGLRGEHIVPIYLCGLGAQLPAMRSRGLSGTEKPITSQSCTARYTVHRCRLFVCLHACGVCACIYASAKCVGAYDVCVYVEVMCACMWRSDIKNIFNCSSTSFWREDPPINPSAHWL